MFNFTAVDGRQMDLSKERGKVVLLDFWATGCVPCVAKLPELESIYQKYHDQGFDILAISVDTDQKKLLQFIQEKAILWPVHMAESAWTNELLMACGVDAIPDYWLIDKKGIVRETMADSNLEKKIEFLLSEP